jgi:hypothetical protein
MVVTEMSLKQRMLNVITAHPRLVTFGISVGIVTALAIGLAAVTGSVDHQAYAVYISQNNNQ